MSVGSVVPRSGGVSLRDVRVTSPLTPSLSATLSEVRIEAQLTGQIREVMVFGGEVSASGSIETIRGELVAFAAARKKPTTAESGPSRGSGAKLGATGLTLKWTGGEDGGADLRKVDVSREGQQVRLLIGEGTATRGGLLATVSGLLVEAEKGLNGYGLRALSSRRLLLDATALSRKEPAPRVDGASPQARGLSPHLAATVRELSARARDLARRTADHVPENAKVSLDGVEASFFAGQAPLHVGPHRLTLSVSPERVHLELSPSAVVAGSTPLAVEATVPLDPDSELSLAVRGGPLPLAALGLNEGDGGLFDLQNGTVEANARLTLVASGDTVKIEGGGAVAKLSLRHAALSGEPLRGLSGGFRLDGELALDGSFVRIERGEVDVGTVHATLSGEAARTSKGNKVRAKYGVPLASCQGLLDALPTGLAPKLSGMKMSGMWSVRGAVVYDGTAPLLVPQIELAVVNECRIVSAPAEVAVARFRRPFRRQVYAPDGSKVEIESGPGTPGWVPLGAISPFVEAAVRTCEDGRFRTHRGFDYEAIRNSIRENLKAGRFVRGASTVTMQTVKNVWLDREKTLGRKLSEAVLTVYLEQEMSKDEILELYLNDIEFGAMVYGIGPAAQHYFRTSPGELSLSQALYLGSILPSPKKSHFGEGGRLIPGRAKYLWMLMRVMERRHLIDAAELAVGLGETPVFGQSAPLQTGVAERGGSGVDDAPIFAP